MVAPRLTCRRIGAEETIAIRWPVLRAGLPRESAVFPGDDRADTRHFGAFLDDCLVGVVTIYPAPLPDQPESTGAWQLRGMAVSPEHQRTGGGHALIQCCLTYLNEAQADLVWCNARSPAVSFYLREGFQTLGKEFEIPTAGPHSACCATCARLSYTSGTNSVGSVSSVRDFLAASLHRQRPQCAAQ